MFGRCFAWFPVREYYHTDAWRWAWLRPVYWEWENGHRVYLIDVH